MSSSTSPAAKKSRSKPRSRSVEAAPKKVHEAKGDLRQEPASSPSFWPETATGRKMLAALLVLGFLLRAYRILEMFPILVDESIYLRWAEIIDHQGQWFISLLDGKQPLQYWLLTILRKVSEGDPLLAARLLSDSTAKVAAVARDVGYESEAAFSRGFKKIVGVSPVTWRRRPTAAPADR